MGFVALGMWAVGLWGCRTVQRWDCGAVGLLGCGAVGLQGFALLVLWQTARRAYLALPCVVCFDDGRCAACEGTRGFRCCSEFPK